MSETETKDISSQVSTALDGLAAKRSEIQGRRSTKPQWASSCRLELPGWPSISIQVERDIALLVFAIGTLGRLAEDLAGHGCDQVWGGYPIEAWVQDLTQRVVWLRDDATLQKIHKLEAQVRPLLTEDQSRERQMDSLSSALAELLD